MSQPAHSKPGAAAAADAQRTVIVDVLCVQPTKVTVLAGTTDAGFADGQFMAKTQQNTSMLSFPQGIWQPDADTVLIADRSNGRIRRFDLADGRMTTFAGCGASAEAEAETERYFDNAQAIDQLEANLYAPSSVCQDPSMPDCLLVATDDAQKVIRRLDTNGNSTIIAGQVEFEEPDPNDAVAMNDWVLKCLEPRTNGLKAVFSDMASMCPGRLRGEPDDLVYISSMSSNIVRSFNPATGDVKLVLGNGTRGDHTQGALEDPFGLAIDSQNRLIVSCLEGYTIVRYDPSAEPNRQVECLAGRSGTRWFRDGMGATDSLLGDPAGICVDPFDTIYFCDYAHGAIRAISPEGYVYTLVCADAEYTQVNFQFAAPFGIIFDRFAYLQGRPRLFVIDFHRLIQIDLDPASFPTPEHPESTGRRQNLAANPNEFSIEQELQLIAQTKEGGETDPTSVQAEELPLEQSVAAPVTAHKVERAPSLRALSKAGSRVSARGIPLSVPDPAQAARAKKQAELAAKSHAKSFAAPSMAAATTVKPAPVLGENRNSASSCSMM